jgi:hypothetical protein
MKLRLLRVHIKVCSPLCHFPGAKPIGTCAQICCYCEKHYVQNLTLNYTIQPLNIYLQCIWKVAMHLKMVLEVRPMSIYTGLNPN